MNPNNQDGVVEVAQVVVNLLGGPAIGKCSICFEQVVLWAVAPNPAQLAVEPDSSCDTSTTSTASRHGWLMVVTLARTAWPGL